MSMKGAAVQRGNAGWTNYMYLLPAVLLIGVFFVSSIFYTGWLSFFESDGFSPPVFTGLENYRYLFQDRVAEGRWEVDGGMWLEADCNISSGEALVRQFLHGIRYFQKAFGRKCEYLWLPDVFGYS